MIKWKFKEFSKLAGDLTPSPIMGNRVNDLSFDEPRSLHVNTIVNAVKNTVNTNLISDDQSRLSVVD